MGVIEFAQSRLDDEIRQNNLGLDNYDTIAYWRAYLDGAKAKEREIENAKNN